MNVIMAAGASEQPACNLADVAESREREPIFVAAVDMSMLFTAV